MNPKATPGEPNPPPDSLGRVRIATFNINGIGARLSNLLDWLGETQPDVACL